jgi:Caspase domain
VIVAFKAAGNRMNIIVLDACRDNPFSGITSGKGLAPIDAPAGTILAYATAPGNVASDGDAKSTNGLYTGFLLQELKKPQTKIEDVFKRVRLNVRRSSQGAQIPWESTSLEDDFYFNTGIKPVEKKSESEAEKTFAIEKADWDKIKNSADVNDYFAFLQKYPSGNLSEQAQFAVDRLQKTTLVSQLTPGVGQVLGSGVNRYKLGDSFNFELRDGASKTIQSRYTQRVTFADDVRVVLNDGEVELDQMGGMVKNSSGTKDPAILQVPADLAVGKKWRSTFTNTRPDGGKSRSYWDAKVVAFEEIETPMGRIMAYKIERSGYAVGDGGGLTQLTGTMWIDPRVMHVVRNDLLYRHKGKVTESSSVVMTAMNKMP